MLTQTSSWAPYLQIGIPLLVIVTIGFLVYKFRISILLSSFILYRIFRIWFYKKTKRFRYKSKEKERKNETEKSPNFFRDPVIQTLFFILCFFIGLGWYLYCICSHQFTPGISGEKIAYASANCFYALAIYSALLLTIIYIAKKSFFEAVEARIYHVMKLGRVKKVVAHIDGWHVNDPHRDYFDERYKAWTILPNTWGAPEDWKKDGVFETTDKGPITPYESWLEKKFGLYCVGLFPINRIDEYELEHLKRVDGIIPSKKPNGSPNTEEYKLMYKGKEKTYIQRPVYVNESEGYTVISRTVPTNYIPFRYMYPAISTGMEVETENATQGAQHLNPLVRIKIVQMNTLQAVNPLQMRFEVANFMEQYRASIKAHNRDIVGNKTLDDLIEMKNELEQQGTFTDQLLEMNVDTPNGNKSVWKEFGFRLTTTNLVDIEPDGDNADKIVSAANDLYLQQVKLENAEKVGKTKGIEYKEELNLKTEADQKRALALGTLKKEKDEKGNDVFVPVPDAKTATIANALEKTGIKVLGGDGINTFLNLND